MIVPLGIHDVIRDVERKKERKKERHLRQWKNVHLEPINKELMLLVII